MSSGSGDVVNDPALDAAVKLHQAGKIDRAARAYRQILESNPNHANAVHLLGVTELQSGHFDTAAEMISRAIALQPNTGTYHLNRATALRALRRIDDAIAEAEKAILLDPKLAPQGYHVAAQAFADAGQPQDAYDCWEKALAAKPDFAEAHLAIATMMDAIGNYFYAIAQRQYAQDKARRMVDRDPDSAPARMLLGRAFEQGGMLEEAVAEYRVATRLLPHDANVFHALGRALRRQGLAEEATTVLRFALRMNPKLADAHAELGAVLLSQGRPGEAVESFRTALSLPPARPDVRAQLADALACAGDIEQAVEQARQAVQADPTAAPARSTLLRTLLLDARVTPRELFDAHVAWDAIHGAAMRAAVANYAKWEQDVSAAAGDAMPVLPPIDKNPDRPLRIGFVSPHFRAHALAKLLIPLLENLDRTQFGIAFYCDAPAHDDVTQQFRKLANAWRDTAALSDTQLALRVREDGIDILVDLTGHGPGNRMSAFAQQPAPVQVTQLGYPFTTGLAAIAYRVGDAIEHPPGGTTDLLHTEKLVRLPRPALCYRPWERTPARLEKRSAAEPIVFGFVGEVAHCSPQTIETWAQILSAAAETRLLVMSSTRDVDQTRARLARHGVSTFRMTVVPPEEGARYLDLFNVMDVALDTFPVSGGTTAGDALWMGRPIVTLASDTMPASRRAAVFLENVGLDDLIASTPQQYVEIAVSLANDRERLARLAETLRETLIRSPVVDAAGCAAAMMKFYRDAWRTWCATTAESGT